MSDITKCVVYALGLSSMEQVASSLSHASTAATNTSGNERVMCYKYREVGHFVKDCQQKFHPKRPVKPEHVTSATNLAIVKTSAKSANNS